MNTLARREHVARKPWQSLRVRVSLAWFGCVWLLTLPAFAQPRIDWQASAGCPSVDAGRAQIEQLLRAPLSELALDVSVTVRLRRDSGSAFSATIEVQQDGLARTRVLHSTDCAVLAHTSAVIAALAIDPAARVDEPSGASEAGDAPASSARSPGPAAQAPQRPASGSPPTAADAPRSVSPAGVGAVPPTAAVSLGVPRSASTAGVGAVPPTAAVSPGVSPRSPNVVDGVVPPKAAASPAPAPVASAAPPAADGGDGSKLQLWLGSALGLDAGNLPKLAPALAWVAGLETSWSRAALRLTYAPAQRATASDLPGVSGRVGLAAAAIEAGLHWYLARLELSSLVGLEAGAFTARASEGVSEQATKRPFWLGSYLAGRIALLASANLTVGLRLEGIIALRRPSFVLRGDLGENRTLHRPDPVSGRGWLELELHFPL